MNEEVRVENATLVQKQMETVPESSYNLTRGLFHSIDKFDVPTLV